MIMKANRLPMRPIKPLGLFENVQVKDWNDDLKIKNVVQFRVR